MKRNNQVFFSLMAMFVVFFITIMSFTSGQMKEYNKQAEPTCCKKTKAKCTEGKKNGPADLMLESMSRQFISISAF